MLHAYRTVSRTDKICGWSRPKSSSADVQTVAEMYKDSSSAHLNRSVTDEDRSFFLQTLQQSGIQCGMSWVLSPEPPADAVRATPTVRDVVFQRNLSHDSSDSDITAFMADLSVTAEQIASVELITRGQQNNPLW